jgi:hypothetical protein
MEGGREDPMDTHCMQQITTEDDAAAGQKLKKQQAARSERL